jgi:hypothetical protein
MVASQPRSIVQRVDLRISQVEPEEAPTPDPAPAEEPSPLLDDETYVDENGHAVTLDDIVSECTEAEDLACEGHRPGHFWLKPRSGHLAGILAKFRSGWAFPKWPFRLRGHSFHQPLFSRHSSLASDCECGDVCEEVCCSDDSCGEVVTDEPVVSTAEPCPACMHVVAPTPAKVSPSTEESIKPAPVPASEEAPPLPLKEVPVREESPAAPEITIDPDSPTKSIPTESTSLFVGLTEVTPTSFEEQGPHAADFSWIVGELGYQHSRGGVWTVRYLPLDRTDVHGGQVILNKDPRLAEFKEGDIVRIEGRISKRSASRPPTYRITAISKVE